MSVKTNNPEALGWKYDYIGGISTNSGVITEWNASLPELTQELVDSIEAEWEASEGHKEKRRSEYPSIDECVHALLDTDHLEALQAKRAAVKLKYPKG